MYHEENPFVPLMLVGRFKIMAGEKLFYQPLAAKTNYGSRLDKWFARLLSCFKWSCNDQGPLFPNGNTKGMSIIEMDVLFLGLLKEVQQQNLSVIPDSVNIEESNSTYLLKYVLFGKVARIKFIEVHQNFNNGGRTSAAIACYLVHGTCTVIIPVVTYST